MFINYSRARILIQVTMFWFPRPSTNRETHPIALKRMFKLIFFFFVVVFNSVLLQQYCIAALEITARQTAAEVPWLRP